MADPDIVLVNSNRMRPPVAPIALDYIASALQQGGRSAGLLDLAFADDIEEAVLEYFDENEPRFVGVTFRNSDDCYLHSRATFVSALTEIIDCIRTATDAPIILGGSAYALFPVELLKRTGADYGVTGDAEEVLPTLLGRLLGGKSVGDVPGVVIRRGDEVTATPPQFGTELAFPSDRSFIDNVRYFEEGGQGGFETRRGCTHHCIYCADPVLAGARVREKPPDQVAKEVRSLVQRGVTVLHTCDPEFNVPPSHGAGVCARMVSRGLGERVQWFAYCTPAPFPAELAAAMRRAGCVGVNIGADSGSDEQLHRLGRGYTAKQVADTVKACKKAGLEVMIDLLLGGPGETPDTCRETIAFYKSLPVDCVGAPVGVRLYPGTPLTKAVLAEGPMAENPNLRGAVEGNASLLEPAFYVAEALGEDPGALVIDLIDGDERFFPPASTRDARDYNYNDNTVLTSAIAAGARGAYWHILNALRKGSSRI